MACVPRRSVVAFFAGAGTKPAPSIPTCSRQTDLEQYAPKSQVMMMVQGSGDGKGANVILLYLRKGLLYPSESEYDQ